MGEPKRRGAKRASAAVIVEEVLSAVLSPRRVREVLEEAQRLGGVTAVPESATPLRVFIEGPLFSALSATVGIGDALDIGAQVRAALALALRDDAPEPVEEASSEVRERRSQAPSAEVVHVLAVTRASVVVFLLSDMLGERAEVASVESEQALVDWLRRLRGRSVLVVVDRKHPVVGPDTCRVLVGLASSTSTVVWWAAEGPEQLDVEERLAGGPRVIPTHRDTDLADLGALCRSVLELS